MHTLIVSNGFPPTKELINAEVEDADLKIAADGGGNTMLDRGVEPDYVIGDLDSFKQPDRMNFELILQAEQETNDLEKALKLALAKGSESCTVLGCFGLRMDHSLKNLSVLAKYDRHFERLVFRDELFDAFKIRERFEAKCEIGCIVSLFPLSGKAEGITTNGLKYALKDESLVNGERDGTSNEAEETQIKIEVKKGDLILFIEREKYKR